MDAKVRRPTSTPKISEFGDYLLYAWSEKTASLGVENWLKANNLVPGTKSDLEALLASGYTDASTAVVALGVDAGQTDHRWLWIAYAFTKGEPLTIDKNERVFGGTSGAHYPGYDWERGARYLVKKLSV